MILWKKKKKIVKSNYHVSVGEGDMPDRKKKTNSCVYQCQKDCMEAAAFVQHSAEIDSIKEQGVAGYDLVYVADLSHKQVFMFGTSGGTNASVQMDLSQPVHQQAHEKAACGDVFHYEWSVCEGEKTCFFQSTLLPLRDSQNRVGSILGLVKNITLLPYQGHAFRLHESRNKTFSQILLAAREEEKRNISSALHDEIGSAAVILTSLLSMVKQSVQMQDQAQALQDIAALDRQIKDSIERVKNIVVSLRPPNLETMDLAEAVQELLASLTHYKKIKHSFVLETADDLPASEEVKIVLYRVAQESLNNIVKHSGATKMEVSIKRGVKDITLKISDNGKGFKLSKQRSIKHIGLLSMRDSVAYLGGKFTIKSQLGKGTTIQARCPKIVYGVKEYEHKSGISR